MVVCLEIRRIGLCGFDNPMRDTKTEESKRHINQGVKIKMDEQGNILIKRLCKSNVYVKPTNQEDNAIGPEIVRNSQGALELEKPGKVGRRRILYDAMTPSGRFFGVLSNFMGCLVLAFFFVQRRKIEMLKAASIGPGIYVTMNVMGLLEILFFDFNRGEFIEKALDG